VSPAVRRLVRRLLLVVAMIVAMAIVAIVALPLFFAPGKVDRADVILHFAFDPRMQGDPYAASLLQQGVAPAIICAGSQASWDVYPSDSSRSHLISLGVPAESVSVLHLPILDCGGEVVPLLVDALKARGARSVLVVTDPTTTRYGAWRFRQRMAAAGIVASTTFAPEDRQDMLSGWWRTHWKAQRIVGAVMNSTIDLLYAPCR